MMFLGYISQAKTKMADSLSGSSLCLLKADDSCFDVASSEAFVVQGEFAVKSLFHSSFL